MSFHPLVGLRYVWFTLRCDACGEEHAGNYPGGTRFVHECVVRPVLAPAKLGSR